MQRHFSASKPDEAGKRFLGVMEGGGPISSSDIHADRKAGAHGGAIGFESHSSAVRHVRTFLRRIDRRRSSLKGRLW
jgi:hypothetical protein